MQLNLAIIILNYFGYDDTVSCIKSIKNSLDSKVFLVDNSAHPSERKKLEDAFKNDPQTHLIFPPENLGFAAGVNLGLKQALEEGYQHFILLNNDAVLLPHSGEIFYNAFKEHPGCLMSPTIIWGEDSHRGHYYHKYFGLICRKPYWQSTNFLYYITGCALAFDKTTVDRIGFFDEAFFFFGEDIEYLHRATNNGLPIILLPEKIVQHHGSKSAKMASLFYEYHLVRAHFLLTFRIVDTLTEQIFSLLGKFLVLGSRAMVRSIRYWSFAPLLGFFLAPINIRSRPSIKENAGNQTRE